jgi:hypothetical protein
MKKMQKMLSVALIGFLLCPLLPIHAAAAPTAVYTMFTSGNDSHTGSGTSSSPYNLFEDALNAVADGGTIYLSGNAFVNSDDNLPLVIDKNVTITRASGLTTQPTLEMRKGGIVLGGDVTFDNVVLAFSNAYRPVICANGYTLTLNNVGRTSGTRLIHLAGGGMSRYNDSSVLESVSPASGGHSYIVINGLSAIFGNIYAGGINSSFDKPVDIELNGVSGSNVGAIYASGALEGAYNGADFINPDNEPGDPTPYADYFPVTGDVSITLTNSTVRTLDGETGGDANASLTVSSQYECAPTISNFAALTVAGGTFSPKATTDGEYILMPTAVTVQSGGKLNLSGLGDCYVGTFTGQGGELQLGSTSRVAILEGCTGTATLSIYGYASATYDHQYIFATTSEDVFQFTPNSAQSDMQLVHVGDGWRTTKQDGSVGAETSDTPTLTSFSLPQTQMQVKDTALNSEGMVIPVDAAFTADSWADDLGTIPLVYTVTYNGKTYVQNKTSDESAYAGYYALTISELNLLLEPGGDSAGQMIQVYPADFTKTIPAGTYTFQITAPLEGGQSVTQTLTLTVVDDSPEKTLWSVDGVYSGGVTVTFRNLTGQTISDGILLAGAYSQGRLQAAQVWTDPISLTANQTQQARFSFTGVQYDEIRLFLCDKQTLLPLCQEYSSAD